MLACAIKITGNADMVICDYFENTPINQNVISQMSKIYLEYSVSTIYFKVYKH